MPTGGGGGGGGGLSSVTTNSTLTGAGTVPSPLGVTNWPVTYFSNTAAINGIGFTLNATIAAGFVLPAAVTFSHIAFAVFNADGTNLYDIGIYNSAGNLVADIGPTHLGSNTFQSIATVQGSVTAQAGLYVFAWTGNATTATIYGGSAPTWFNGNVSSATVGGQLNASISFPSKSTSTNGMWFALQ